MNSVESIYFHVPFCMHLCNYCDFYKMKTKESFNFDHFESQINESLPLHAQFLEQNAFELSPLKTFYMGGGTPSLWGLRGIKFLENFFHNQNISFQKNYEMTLEIDPASTTKEEINEWKNLGVNRFSVGLQTWNEPMLKVMDRVHTIEQATSLLEFLAAENLNFSVDFMLGLPKSKDHKRDIKNELESILKFSPKHVSLYLLDVPKTYIHYPEIPQDDFTGDEYILVDSYLSERGFHHYEVSNYGLSGFESSHNYQYWKNNSVAAFGPSATGLLKFNDQKAIRYKWKSGLKEFNQELLSKREIDLEKLYTGLRLSRGICLKEFFEGETLEKVQSLANSWQERGIGLFRDDVVHLNAKGYLLLDSLMDEIFSVEST